MEKTLLGYIVFVSYNRDEYELDDIAIDDMRLKEFIHFIKNDKVQCLNVAVTPIFNTTKPDGNSSKIWETDEYEGHYAKYPNSDYLFIQERDNVVNFLTAYVEEREVM